MQTIYSQVPNKCTVFKRIKSLPIGSIKMTLSRLSIAKRSFSKLVPLLLIIAIDKTFQSAKTQTDFAQLEFEICLNSWNRVCIFAKKNYCFVQKCSEKTHRFLKSVRKTKIDISSSHPICSVQKGVDQQMIFWKAKDISMSKKRVLFFTVNIWNLNSIKPNIYLLNVFPFFLIFGLDGRLSLESQIDNSVRLLFFQSVRKTVYY